MYYRMYKLLLHYINMVHYNDLHNDLHYNFTCDDNKNSVNFTVTLDDPKIPIFPSILHVILSGPRIKLL